MRVHHRSAEHDAAPLTARGVDLAAGSSKCRTQALTWVFRMANFRRHQMIGATVGSYRIVSALGKGAMGEVFLAEHQHIARRAAIKVLIPQLTQYYEVVHRFFVEARAMSMIQHPGIVEVFDCAVHTDGRAYIVMEYLEGETLAAALLREERLPWQRATAIAREIAEALGAAHDQGIAHRDLKPENVFLRVDADAPDGASVKVLDFGVAKLLDAESLEGIRTRNGTLLGTPAYMSPEQCAGGGQIDHRVDVYALGCLLFEMLTGRPPFCARGAEPKTFNELALAHLHRPPPSPRAEAPDVPRWLDSLVKRLMAKHPDDRPDSMRAVAAGLAQNEDVAPASRSRQRGMGVAQLAMAAGGLLIFPLMIVFVSHLWSARHRNLELPLVESLASPMPGAPALTAAAETPPAPLPRLTLPAAVAPSAGEDTPGEVQNSVAPPPSSPRRGSSSVRRRAQTTAAPIVGPAAPSGTAIGDADGIVDL
jgi:serine/threonine protein kinase